jgi:hypothetical protein
LPRPPAANHTIFVDTVDVGVPSKDSGIHLLQTRVDAFPKSALTPQASLLKNKSSSESWRAFYHDHILKFGRPSIVITDQGPEFVGSFSRNCLDEGILHKFSAVASGRSNLVERTHRELWSAICTELAERNMPIEQWSDVLDIV